MALANSFTTSSKVHTKHMCHQCVSMTLHFEALLFFVCYLRAGLSVGLISVKQHIIRYGNIMMNNRITQAVKTNPHIN